MKKAYLIVDMCNDFVDRNGGLWAGEAAIEIVDAIANKAEQYIKEGQIVVFTIDSHQPDDKHFDLWPKHCVRGTWGQKPYGRLGEIFEQYRNQILYIPKTQYNAFYETDLAQRLKELAVEQVEVCGVCTDICVYQTVGGAYNEGFQTIVNKNECATFTPHHELFLQHMQDVFCTKVL